MSWVMFQSYLRVPGLFEVILMTTKSNVVISNRNQLISSPFAVLIDLCGRNNAKGVPDDQTAPELAVQRSCEAAKAWRVLSRPLAC